MRRPNRTMKPLAVVTPQLRPMNIGDPVTFRGRSCYLRGLDPMSVSERRAELEDATTGERFAAPLEEVQPATERFDENPLS